MLIDNVNIWLLMMQNENILGEKPTSVSVEFNGKDATLTAKFKEGVATSQVLINDLENLVGDEVKPNDNIWTRS